MSRTHYQMTLKAFHAYMENLATQMEAIGHTTSSCHFVRMSLLDALEANLTKLNSPAMLVENYDARGVDAKSNNLMVQRMVAFTIAKKLPGKDKDNPATRLDYETDCETIALQVLARMRKDRVHLGGSVFADVDLDAWEGEVATPFFAGDWAAYRVMVPVSNVDRRLAYDSGLWSDDSTPAVPVDVSGLSCSNLNDASLGLTDQQRLVCVLPGYDFADSTVQNALTAQQVADLTAWLGGGVFTPATVYKSNGSTLVVELDSGETYSIPKHSIYYTTISRGNLLVQADEFDVDFVIPNITLTDDEGAELPLWNNHVDSGDIVKADYLGNTQVYLAPSPGNLKVPPVRIAARDASNAVVDLYLAKVLNWDVDTSGTDHHQDVDYVVPRVAILLSDGVTPYGYVGVDDPSMVLAAASVNDTDGNLLAEVDAGATAVAPDATVKTTDGVTIVDTILAGGEKSLPASKVPYTAADGSAAFTDQADTAMNGGLLYPDMAIPRQQILNSAGNPANSTYLDLDDLIAGTVPVAQNGTAVVKNSAGGTLVTDTGIPSNGSKDVSVPDITVTDQDGSDSDMPAGVSIDIRDYRSGIVYRPLQWSGEANTYGTGSEGYLFANGFMNYVPVAFPESYARLDKDAARPFHTLVHNNVFGHKNRFCGTTGGYHDGTNYKTVSGTTTTQAVAFPNSEVIDTLSGAMYKFTPEASAVWATAIANGYASTHNSRSGWHTSTESGLYLIMDGSLGTNPLNYAPFFITGTALWSSTTHNSVTTSARSMGTNGVVGATAKSSSLAYLICRAHLT